MKRIALTGGIACGKSLAARFLNACGVKTLDADDIVHELIPVEERRRLAAIVFRDPAARQIFGRGVAEGRKGRGRKCLRK